MARRDKYHDIFARAITAENWQIIKDPLRTKYGTFTIFVDLGAKQLLGAEKDGRTIAIEVKSFLNPSTISDFYVAVGQFVCYRIILRETQPEYELYLAVPQSVYDTLLDTNFGELAINELELKIIVFDEELEAITTWIE